MKMCIVCMQCRVLNACKIYEDSKIFKVYIGIGLINFQGTNGSKTI